MIKKVILFVITALLIISLSFFASQSSQSPRVGPEDNEVTLGDSAVSADPTPSAEHETIVPETPVPQETSTESPTEAEPEPTNIATETYTGASETETPTEAVSEKTPPTPVPTERPTEEPIQPAPTEAPTIPEASRSTSSGESPHVHMFGAYEVNQFKSPSASRPGEIFRFCDCGYRDSREIPSLNYNVTDPVTGEHICALYSVSVSATCLKPKHSLTLCTGCDYVSEYMDPSSQLANHAYSDWTITKEATATEQGEQTRTCSVCGKVNAEIIPVTGEQKESYIDPSLSFYTTPAGARCYINTYCHVIDTRTWGDSPSITIYDEYSLHVEYYKQNGEMVVVDVDAIIKQYYSVVCIIAEDGSYSVHVNYTNFQ